MKRAVLISFALLFLAAVAVADEGMWLFNLPPTQQLKSKYGFDLTKGWLQHTQLSSVRFNNGGSGSFVSLLMERRGNARLVITTRRALSLRCQALVGFEAPQR